MCGYYCTCTVCMVIIYSKSMDQPGKVVNPVRGQLNRGNEYFPVRVRSRLRILVSRDGFGSPVPRQSAHLHTQAVSGAYFEIPTDFLGGVHLFILNRHKRSMPGVRRHNTTSKPQGSPERELPRQVRSLWTN